MFSEYSKWSRGVVKKEIETNETAGIKHYLFFILLIAFSQHIMQLICIFSSEIYDPPEVVDEEEAELENVEEEIEMEQAAGIQLIFL